MNVKKKTNINIHVFFSRFKSVGFTKRKEGELSAYEVFNPNQQALAGTFRAEQFDKQLRNQS